MEVLGFVTIVESKVLEKRIGGERGGEEVCREEA